MFFLISLFFFLNSFAFAVQEPVLVSSQAVPFEAGRLRYDEKHGILFFEDGYTLWRGSQTIKGKTMVYSTKSYTADAQEGFTLWQGSQSLRGRRLVYNTQTRLYHAQGALEVYDPDLRLFGERLEAKDSSGTVHWEGSVRGYFQETPWRFTAKSLDGNSSLYLSDRVHFTSCNKLHPDYHIWAWQGKIWPGEKASFKHAVFFLGPIPFWYMPFYSKPLGKPRPYTFYINPGQNSREGLFARTVIAVPFYSDKLYLRQHIDIFSNTGIGWGPEFLYRDGESRKGTLSFYTIKEQSGLRQWDVRGDSFVQIRRDLGLQASLRYQRDPGFNNLYSLDNPVRINPDLQSSMALNWHRSQFQLRTFYSDVWGYDQVAGKFLSTSRTLPGIEGIMHPYSILKGALVVQGNAAFHRLESRPADVNVRPFVRWQDTGNVSILRPWKFPLVSFFSGTIGGNFNHTYTSHESLERQGSIRTSRYGGDLAARLAPWDILDLGMVYTMAWRSETNSFRQDTTSPDNGLDTKRLAITESSRLPFNSNFYARTAYNFPRIPGVRPERWTQNLDPVWASLASSPWPGVSSNLTTTYDAFNREYNYSMGLGYAARRANFNASFNHDTRRPDYVAPTLSADFPLPGIFQRFKVTWRGEYFTRDKVLSYHKDVLRTTEREFIVIPDLHDFFLTLVLRDRKEYRPAPLPPRLHREFFFNIRLKLGKEDEENKLLRQLNEPEFYPWRADLQGRPER